MVAKVSRWEKLMSYKGISWWGILVSAIFFTLGVQAFLQVAGTFPSGISAIAALITFTVKPLTPYFSVLYLLINIPLIAIFWKKNRRSFTNKTIFFLTLQALLGSAFIFFPGLRNVFASILIPGKTIIELRELYWPILVLSVIGSILCGFAIALSWMFGGSTGGADIITYYFSTKKGKSIGSVTFVIALIFVVFSFGLTTILVPSTRPFWFITLISTLSYIGIVAIIIDMIYPKYSKVEVNVASKNPDAILKALKDINFSHAYQIRDVVSGFSGKNKKIISSVILYLELKRFVRLCQEIDESVWISATVVTKLNGNFNYDFVEKK